VTLLLLFGCLRIRSTLARSLICGLAQLLVLLSPIASPRAAGPPVPIPTLERTPTQSPGTMPEIAVPSGPVSLAPSSEGFVLSAVSIEGSTIFTEGQLEPTYREYLGHRIDLDAVREIVSRISAKYREIGLFLSHAVALPQSLSSGVLHVHVIEGYVERVTIRGATPTQEQALHTYMAKLGGERPLRLTSLERAILLVKDLPGIAISPSIAPVDEAAGRYELVLIIETARVSGYAASDNRGPRYLGPWEAEASGAVTSLVMPFDQLSAYLLTVPNLPSELLAGGIVYDASIGSDGLRGSLAVARTSIHPGDYLARLELRGVTNNYISRISHPLLRTRTQSLWVGGAFNIVESRENEPSVPVFSDHLRVVRVDATYFASDGWGGSNKVFAQLSQGLDVLGASSLGSANLSTPNGHATFTKVTGSITREQPIIGGFGIFVDFAGQKAGQPLLLSEQFALGGARFGRGYDPAQVVGDDALAGLVELRYDHGVEDGFLRAFQVYAFYDLGTVWNISPNNPQRSASLASAGGGVRFALAERVLLSLELAKPLTHPLVPDRDKPIRVFARLSKAF
jgi:hemolysin activation/secretion protein